MLSVGGINRTNILYGGLRMIKLIIIGVIALIIGGFGGFGIGYCCGSYGEQTNHLGIKNKNRFKF